MTERAAHHTFRSGLESWENAQLHLAFRPIPKPESCAAGNSMSYKSGIYNSFAHLFAGRSHHVFALYGERGAAIYGNC